MRSNSQPTLEKLRKFIFAAMLLGLTVGLTACDESFFDDDDDDDEDVLLVIENQNDTAFEMDSLNTIDMNKPEE